MTISSSQKKRVVDLGLTKRRFDFEFLLEILRFSLSDLQSPMSVDNVLDDLFPTDDDKSSEVRKMTNVSGSMFGGDTEDDETSSDESASSSDDFEELEVFDDKNRVRKEQKRGQDIVKVKKQQRTSKPKPVKLPSGPAYNDQRTFEREIKTGETSKAPRIFQVTLPFKS